MKRFHSIGFAVLLITGLFFSGCSQGPSTYFWEAADALRTKNYPEAQDLARRTLVAQADYMPAYLLLARVAALQNDEQSAELNYRSAYDLALQREFKLRSEDVQAADSDLKFQWQEAAFFLADAEFRRMNYNGAARFYDSVIQDPGSGDWKKKAIDDKQTVREFSGYRSKLEMLRAQNYKSPNDPRIQAEMSALFMEMASGLTRLGKMKSVAEQVALAGKFREQARQALEALYSASPEVKLPQTEAQLDYTESQENIMRGKTDEALQNALYACQKDPSNGKYHFTVSSILAVQAVRKQDPGYRMDDRMNYALKAIELEPKVWRYQTAYAGLLRDNGRLQEAYDYLLKARDNIRDQEILDQVDAALADIEKQISEKSSTPKPSGP